MCGAKVICEMLIRGKRQKKKTLAVTNDECLYVCGLGCVLTCGTFDKYSKIIKFSNYSKDLIVGSALKKNCVDNKIVF